MIQSWVFPVRFDSKRIRGALGETRGNPFTSGGALVCAPALTGKAEQRAARRKESRDIMKPTRSL
jgi:hypothetical protein